MENKRKKEVPLELIEKWLKDSDWRVRAAAMNACNGREVPIEVIEKGLKDSYCDVRAAAMNACNGREVPIEFIEKGLKDSDCDVRAAAMNACNGREVLIEVIEKWLKDSDWRVRVAAMNACKKNGIEIPPTRTFNPPTKVYKKCVCGVIVVAEIPETAHVRGAEGRKCRASEAIITEIIGDIGGKEIGISQYDPKTLYEVGDHVIIDDFDFSDEECSTGFHFLCTKKEAENY